MGHHTYSKSHLTCNILQPFGGVGLLPLKRPIWRIHQIHAKSYELDAEIKSA
jgi:hypothetical protein